MNQAVKPQMRKPKETGVPDNQKYMHPTLLKNYGNWRYHDRPRPGVLHHVAHSGDRQRTVVVGGCSIAQLSVAVIAPRPHRPVHAQRHAVIASRRNRDGLR